MACWIKDMNFLACVIWWERLGKVFDYIHHTKFGYIGNYEIARFKLVQSSNIKDDTVKNIRTSGSGPKFEA